MIEDAPDIGRRAFAQGILTGGEQIEGDGVPSGWAQAPICEIAPLQRGFDLPTSQLRSGPHPVVYSNGVIQHHDRAMVKGPGVVTGRSGTIGQVHFIEKDYWPHNTTLWVTSFHGNDPKFIYYLYAHLNLARFLSGSGVPTLNRNDVHQHLVACPPFLEQRAIAKALSDVDELIGSLERLIAKKRAIKQAAMQELLIGKTRLPGFSGVWEMKRLGEIASIRNHKVLPSNVPPDTPCVELDHIEEGKGRLLGCSTAQHSTSSKYRFLSGDVLFGRLRSYLRKFWLADRDGICTTEIWPLSTDPQQSDSGFLHAIVQCEQFIEVASISYGTHMPRADWGVIQNFEIRLPQVQEQRAIAAILSDMDAEIAALERRRDKTRAIKQGMMQQLLTGRVRLVKPEYTMTIETVERDFHDKVSTKIRLAAEGMDRFRVFTPFLFEDGDHLSIVLKKEGTGWVLSDEAHTYMHLTYDLDERDLQTGTRQKIIANALSVFQVEDRDGELILEVPDERYGDALYSFVQALLKIADVKERRS